MSHIERAVMNCRYLNMTLGAVGLLLVSMGSAQTDAVRFDIPAQSLASALQAFAAQANMQLLYVYDAVAKIQVNAVRGQLDKHAALALLLRDTGFEAKYSGANTAIIRPVRRPVAEGASDPSRARNERARASASSNDSQAQKPVVLEEVIVTAQKRKERLQEVPVPVAALPAAPLADKSAFRMQDYYGRVPGLALTPNQFSGAPSIAIRGITSSDATNPTVGVTVDDVPFGSSTSIGGGYFAPDLDPSDLARVEVLRGPQGTLYGAASVGGLVKFVTVDPDPCEWHARVQTGLNSVRRSGGVGYNLSAAVNVPVSDDFAVRFSGFMRKQSGYIDNVRAERDVNQTRLAGGHVSARWSPSDQFSLKLSALLQKNEIHGAPYVTVTPGVGDLQQDFLPRTGSIEREFQAYSATVVANLDAVELTSVTGYGESHLLDLLDYTALNGDFTREAFGTEDTLNADHNTTYKFSQELRAAAQLGANIEVLIGAYYSREYSPYTVEIFAAAPDGRPGERGVASRFFSTFREWAGFADLTYHFTDRFDVQVGGRRSQIKQSFGETDTGPFVPLLLETTSPRVLPEEFAREHATTYLVTPRFNVSPDLMLYARVASGYRPGGINQGDFPGLPARYVPDKTLNYEVGLKSSALDGRLLFDGSIYYIDWKDIQLALVNLANGQIYFTNGSRARSKGVELSMQWMPVEALRLGVWAAWNDAALTEAMPPPDQGGVNGPIGARLPFSSRFSANASIDYAFPFASLTGAVGATASFVGNRIGVFITDDSERQSFPAYTQLDAHAGMKTEQWSFDLYVNNVTDERGVLGGGSGTITPTAFQVIQPRTVGFSIARTF